MREWKHTATRLAVDQRTNPGAETFLLLLATCLFHAAATLAAFAALWVLSIFGIPQGRRAGAIVVWILFLPAIVTRLAFRWQVKARPTPGFTTKVALAFTATNSLYGAIAVLAWPNLLAELPQLIPMQKWGFMLALGALSWIVSATAFHISTRGKGAPNPQRTTSDTRLLNQRHDGE
jgi:hypothetical protein